MRRPLRLVLLALLAAAGLVAAGCDQGREVNNPFGGIDHDYRYVGQVDRIPHNGK